MDGAHDVIQSLPFDLVCLLFRKVETHRLPIRNILVAELSSIMILQQSKN